MKANDCDVFIINLFIRLFADYVKIFRKFRVGIVRWHGPGVGAGNFRGQGQKLFEGSPRGGSGGGDPWTREKMSNIFIKKSMKNYKVRPIFHKFNENFAIFTKFGEKFRRMLLYGVRGGAEPPKLAILLKIVQKAMETSYFFENFPKLWENLIFRN